VDLLVAMRATISNFLFDVVVAEDTPEVSSSLSRFEVQDV
jgi:hypothetical protein